MSASSSQQYDMHTSSRRFKVDFVCSFWSFSFFFCLFLHLPLHVALCHLVVVDDTGNDMRNNWHRFDHVSSRALSDGRCTKKLNYVLPDRLSFTVTAKHSNNCSMQIMTMISIAFWVHLQLKTFRRVETVFQFLHFFLCQTHLKWSKSSYRVDTKQKQKHNNTATFPVSIILFYLLFFSFFIVFRVSFNF